MAGSCRHDQPGKSHVVCLRSTGVLPVVVGDGKLEGGREGREGGERRRRFYTCFVIRYQVPYLMHGILRGHSSLGSYPLFWQIPKSLFYLCRLPVYMRVDVVMMVRSLYSRMEAIERREEQETPAGMCVAVVCRRYQMEP